MRLLRFVYVASVSLFAASVQAKFMQPENVPVKRLLEVTSKAVREHPGDAAAHYALARVRYLAFATGAEKVQAYLPGGGRDKTIIGPFDRNSAAGEKQCGEEAERRVAMEKKDGKPVDVVEDFDWFSKRVEEVKKQLQADGWAPDRISEAEATGHVAGAVAEFRAALGLDPKNALYQLGYASLSEQVSAWARNHPHADVPEELRALTPAAIRAGYLAAWHLELQTDLEHKERGAMSAMNMVSYEAGTAFVRLAEAAGNDLPSEEKQSLEKVRESLVTLAQGSGLMITPIVFATRPVSGLAELLAPETVVTFPLRGWGPAGRWSWVKPETALLVWDPRGDGRIRDGTQLFGSYTWELFWNNGYEPLAVLDLDGDGSLTGTELAGLGAWFDRDGNGVCDPGEVVPLALLGVTALVVRPVGFDGDAPTNPRGITFADGRVLPTWDWIVAESPVNPTQGLKFAREH